MEEEISLAEASIECCEGYEFVWFVDLNRFLIEALHIRS